MGSINGMDMPSFLGNHKETQTAAREAKRRAAEKGNHTAAASASFSAFSLSHTPRR